MYFRLIVPTLNSHVTFDPVYQAVLHRGFCWIKNRIFASYLPAHLHGIHTIVTWFQISFDLRVKCIYSLFGFWIVDQVFVTLPRIMTFIPSFVYFGVPLYRNWILVCNFQPYPPIFCEYLIRFLNCFNGAYKILRQNFVNYSIFPCGVGSIVSIGLLSRWRIR